MFKYLSTLSLLLFQIYSFRPFEFYEYVCNLQPDCYTLYNDHSVLPSKEDFTPISKWSYIAPYSDPSTNIGFAQSHAQAMSFKLWKNDPSKIGSVFSESSFIRAGHEAGYRVCESPILDSSHLPFEFNFIEENVSKVYLKPAFQDFDLGGKWCDLEGLGKVVVEKEQGFDFPGYDFEILLSRMSFERIQAMLKNKGIGIIGVKHDYNMIDGYQYFDDGIYRPDRSVYHYPANVVGVKKDQTGSIWLLSYVFGAHLEDNNYLWVNVKDVVGDYMAFIKDINLV